jgi:hypothetical protein
MGKNMAFRISFLAEIQRTGLRLAAKCKIQTEELVVWQNHPNLDY